MKQAQIAITFGLGLLLTLLVYWPALGGPFLFDDISNLRHLADNGGVDDLETFIAFVFSGDAGRLGRPIALASFLLHDTFWPTEPWAFKYTNLLLHLLNGILIFWLCRQISCTLHIRENRRDWFALAVAGLWLLHPMQLSATMLVVQRMNEIATLFILSALITYLHGRSIAATHPRRSYAWMTAAVTIGLPLAVFSKENGILLCGYLLVLEGTILRDQARPYAWRYWAFAFLVGPLALLAAYFLLNWDGLRAGFAHRDFTQSERLLTEGRILFDYLGQILLPQLGGGGLFHDDYQVSSSLWNPPQTVLAVAALAAAAISAVLLRKRYPIWSLAVLWFLVGHSLESSFISLELYFEHRNYLPMLGPLFGIAYIAAIAPRRLSRLLAVGIACIIAISSALTLQSSQIWGDHALLTNVWAHENPTSARAHQYAADYWKKENEPKAALWHLIRAAEANPNDLSVHTQVVYMRCVLGDFSEVEYRQLLSLASENGSFSNATVSTIDNLSRLLEQRNCGELHQSDLLNLLDRLLANPKYNVKSETVRNIWFSKAKILAAERHLKPAIDALDKAYEASPHIDIPILQVGLLLSAGLPERALFYYDLAKRHNDNREWHAVDRSEDLEIIAGDIHDQISENSDP